MSTTALMQHVDRPNLATVAPSGPIVTSYDQAYMLIYAELLHAAAHGQDWRETSRSTLGIDPDLDLNVARSAFVTHLVRAKWLASQGMLRSCFGSA
jgi:hypothetical protein